MFELERILLFPAPPSFSRPPQSLFSVALVCLPWTCSINQAGSGPVACFLRAEIIGFFHQAKPAKISCNKRLKFISFSQSRVINLDVLSNTDNFIWIISIISVIQTDEVMDKVHLLGILQYMIRQGALFKFCLQGGLPDTSLRSLKWQNFLDLATVLEQFWVLGSWGM